MSRLRVWKHFQTQHYLEEKEKQKMSNLIGSSFAAVQVVQRDERGTLTLWADTGMRGTKKDAIEEMKKLQESNPNNEYTIIERSITEVQGVPLTDAQIDTLEQGGMK